MLKSTKHRSSLYLIQAIHVHFDSFLADLRPELSKYSSIYNFIAILRQSQYAVINSCEILHLGNGDILHRCVYNYILPRATDYKPCVKKYTLVPSPLA